MLFKIVPLILDLVCSLWYLFYISLDSLLKFSVCVSSKFIVGEEVYLYSFLMLAVDKGALPSSRTGHFSHARRTLSRRLVGPQSGRGLLDKTKTSFPSSIWSVKNNRSNCCNKCKVVLCTRWLRELKPCIMGDILMHEIWRSHISDCGDYSWCILVDNLLMFERSIHFFYQGNLHAFSKYCGWHFHTRIKFTVSSAKDLEFKSLFFA